MTRVFCGGLSNRIYAAARVRPTGNGGFEVVGSKTDVTVDALRAVAEHTSRCENNECACKTYFAPQDAT